MQNAVFLLYFTSSVYLMEVKMHKSLDGQQVSLYKTSTPSSVHQQSSA